MRVALVNDGPVTCCWTVGVSSRVETDEMEQDVLDALQRFFQQSIDPDLPERAAAELKRQRQEPVETTAEESTAVATRWRPKATSAPWSTGRPCVPMGSVPVRTRAWPCLRSPRTAPAPSPSIRRRSTSPPYDAEPHWVGRTASPLRPHQAPSANTASPFTRRGERLLPLPLADAYIHVGWLHDAPGARWGLAVELAPHDSFYRY